MPASAATMIGRATLIGLAASATLVSAAPARARVGRAAASLSDLSGCCAWGGSCAPLCSELDGSSYCHLSPGNCESDCGGSFVEGGVPTNNCDGGDSSSSSSSASSSSVSAVDPYTADGMLSTGVVGSSFARLAEFAGALASHSVAADPEALAVHSSGGVAGGVVSEGQGYGLLIAGGTLAAMGAADANRPEALALFRGFFLGWRRMCELSADDLSCQADEGFKCGGGEYPCLPHWKFDDAITGAESTGAAPDGDEDAMAGMILGVHAVAADASPPVWFDEVAEWAYATCDQFYHSNTVASSTGNHRIVKLGTCWGGWGGAGQNPSYHAPGAYRLCRDFMAQYDGRFGGSATEGDELAAGWNTVISTTYKMFAADQCAATGLITNWAEVSEAADGVSLTATIGMSGSGTPAAEYGAEAGRGVWRVALDYALYPTEAATAAGSFLSPVVEHVARKEAGGSFADELDVVSGCLVDSVHSSWQWNAFMAGPTFSALVCPAEGVGADRQVEVLEAAGHRIAGFGIDHYYSGSWVAIATMTLNGDFARAGQLVRGGRSDDAAATATEAPAAATGAVTTGAKAATTDAPTTAATTIITSTTTPTEAPRVTTAPAVTDPPTTETETASGCCTWDLAQGCQAGPTDWCGASEDRCTGPCSGAWMGGSGGDPNQEETTAAAVTQTTRSTTSTEAPTTEAPTTEAVAATEAPAAGICVALWGQCGGQNYDGVASGTSCCGNAVCTFGNAYYSQCRPN